jgi:hypothetical protein
MLSTSATRADGGEAESEAVCPDLARIVTAWPMLPVEVKAAIVAMVSDAKALKVLSP